MEDHLQARRNDSPFLCIFFRSLSVMPASNLCPIRCVCVLLSFLCCFHGPLCSTFNSNFLSSRAKQGPLSIEAVAPFKEGPTLFISEIKTVKPELPDHEQNNCLLDDMNLQMSIHKSLNPVRSLLTFRLPWRSGKTDYLKGMVRVWVRRSRNAALLLRSQLALAWWGQLGPRGIQRNDAVSKVIKVLVVVRIKHTESRG